MDHDKDMAKLTSFLLEDDYQGVKQLLGHLLNNKSMRYMEQVMVDVMEAIGTGWTEGTYSLAQVYLTGNLLEKVVMELIDEKKVQHTKETRLAICVLMDNHELGKKIVKTILHVAGYEVEDYGMGLTTEALWQKVQASQPDFLLISTLMLTSTLKVQEITKRIRDSGLATKVIIGGAPVRFDPALIDNTGADAGAAYAEEILPLLRSLGGAR